jgi:hypothetical protein
VTEINECHMEWATVERMRAMLSSVRRDYEITQTYTLFTGILCWTIERIRSHDDASVVVARLRSLKIELEDTAIRDYVGGLHSQRLVSVPAYNDFSGFTRLGEGQDKALSVLVALRNAVAHGDARSVRPINEKGRLMGYELTWGNKKDPSKDPTVSVRLNRIGMVAIADQIAQDFCRAVIGPEGRDAEFDAQHIREGRG